MRFRLPYKSVPRKVVLEKRLSSSSTFSHKSDQSHAKCYCKENYLDQTNQTRIQIVLNEMNKEMTRLKSELRQEKSRVLAMSQKIDALNEDLLKFQF